MGLGIAVADGMAVGGNDVLVGMTVAVKGRTVMVKGKTVMVYGRSVSVGKGVTVLPGRGVGRGVRVATLGTQRISPG